MGLHWELLLPLLAIVMLFFGAKRLPEIGSAAGQTIKEFQKAFRDKDTAEPAALPPAQDTDASQR
ncbi:MAG TPA: twin-arginine translocase TatA/TatE family subunit [Ktedonobacterales bacterium]